jgi:hypothetical protein
VYSNLVRVTDALWEVFQLSGVRVATSYYSAYGAQHNAVTGRRSHDRTLANIRETLRRGIPIRVGLVDVDDGQDVAGAVAELRALGVEHLSMDRVRQVGRGVRDQPTSVDQLCGHCADSSLAVLPTGEVLPCVLARWMVLGNVRTAALEEINGLAEVTRTELRERFATNPDMDCDPNCQPKDCDPVKGDGKPGGCDPDYQECDPWKKK